ncbi:hypothetical protein WDZ17_08235 [Pseudokineococcus basanitobsidens]|uniref:Bacteriocin biosynthesis cyclodehydratase domain-containing protein n=1 Tax=Pseudokineococcus basanitobsidens TaxID=1926649 RepID=A0ABU8RJL8_9ACTN
MGALLRTRPALRRLWRDVGRVQLGEDAAHAVVLDGLGPGEEALLDDLAVGVDLSELRARRRGRDGASPAAVEHLLSLLRAADALEPSPAPGARARARAGAAEAAALGLVHGGSGWDVLDRRAAATVRVEGGSRTAAALASGLVEAGVGRVEVAARPQAGTRADHGALGGLPPGDVGQPADGPPVSSPPRELPREGGRPVDLTVLVARGAVPPHRAHALVREDAVHLPVVLRVRSADVGPLVVPGRSACLRCVDLRRTDRDAEWPRVAAQLAHPAAPAPGAGGEDVVLARSVSALAVVRVLHHLDEPPAGRRSDRTRVPPGTAWEVDVADGLARSRTWAPHPRCGCTWPPG